MIRIKLKQYLGSIVTIAAVLFLFVVLFSSPVMADENTASEVNTTITLSNSGNVSKMTDGSYNTKTSFASGDSITVTGKDKIYSLYIKWDLVPDEWTLSYNGTTKTYGTNGFLHEYVEIPEALKHLRLHFLQMKQYVTCMHIQPAQHLQMYRHGKRLVIKQIYLCLQLMPMMKFFSWEEYLQHMEASRI